MRDGVNLTDFFRGHALKKFSYLASEHICEYISLD